METDLSTGENVTIHAPSRVKIDYAVLSRIFALCYARAANLMQSLYLLLQY